MSKILLALLAATALFVVAAPPAQAVSAGFCVVGICDGVGPVPDPVPTGLGCTDVGTPPVDPVLGADAILVEVCG